MMLQPSQRLNRVRSTLRAHRAQRQRTARKVKQAVKALKAITALKVLQPLPRQPQPRRPSQSSQWWRCVGTIVPGKRKPMPHRVVMAAPACDRAIAAHARVSGAATEWANAAIAANVANATMAVGSEKTEARAWVMPHSVRNAKPWSVPKCRCANWLRKRTVRP